MTKVILSLFVFCFANLLTAQEVIPLYHGKVPNSRNMNNTEKVILAEDGGARVSKVSEPTLTAYLPDKDKANGTAVIICPGGGYTRLSIKKEGDDVALVLKDWGVAAFVLKYRLPDDTLMEKKEIGPLQDAQRAIQLIRQRAREWNINPKKVGIMGFSAGGHLAATLGTHYKTNVIENKDRLNLRPDFLILMYPVISFTDSLAHKGSRNNLIGSNPSDKMIKEYSNEMQVTGTTPPSFLVHARDDKTVPVGNSIAFYDALKKKNVPAEIHFYERGGHGFGLVNNTSSDKWTDWLKVWMKKYL